MSAFKPIKDVGMIYGSQLGSYGISSFFKYWETFAPEGFLGASISVWGDLIGALGGIIGGFTLDYPYNYIATLVGGSLFNDLLKQLTPQSSMRIAMPPPLVYTSPGTVTTPAVTAKGRYIVA